MQFVTLRGGVMGAGIARLRIKVRVSVPLLGLNRLSNSYLVS